MYHPHAFKGLHNAFDIYYNLSYGAQLLVALHQRCKSWEKAVSLYHSFRPHLAQTYQKKVFAIWDGEKKKSLVFKKAHYKKSIYNKQ